MQAREITTSIEMIEIELEYMRADLFYLCESATQSTDVAGVRGIFARINAAQNALGIARSLVNGTPEVERLRIANW